MVQMQIDFDEEENATIGIYMYSRKLKDKKEAVRAIVREFAEQRK